MQRQWMHCLLLLLLLSLTSCVFHASAFGTVWIKGQVLDADKRPVAGVKVEIWTESLVGNSLLKRVPIPPPYVRAVTDEDGRFSHTLRLIYGAGMWFLPPLGIRPRCPPAPRILVCVPHLLKDCIWVDPHDGTTRLVDALNWKPMGEALVPVVVSDYEVTEWPSEDGELWTVATIQLAFQQVEQK